nr:organomercurial lyase [Cellulosimicrobium cellulans]
MHLDVRIDTACPHCGKPLAYSAGPTTPPPDDLAVRFPRPTAQWWDDVVATCSMIRTFCHRDHADRWTADHAPDAGFVAEATTVWRLAAPWYGDRLDPRYAAHSREHNQRLLDQVGLTGSFWVLP